MNQLKWEAYQTHMNNARYCHALGDDVACWWELLRAAEVNWTSNTPKQVQQRKLASQLWMIGGLIGNSKQLRYQLTDDDKHVRMMSNVLIYLEAVEKNLRLQMRNIK